jgi:peptide chain release factor 1
MIEKKVRELLEKLTEVEEKLGASHVFNDQKLYKELTREHSYLTEVNEAWSQFSLYKKQLKDNLELLKEETDPEFIEELKKDVEELEAKIEKKGFELETLLVPPDPNDSKPLLLELRAGTGGDEAALFVGDCVRMYKLFADLKGWRYEVLSSAPAEYGGFREYIMGLSGQNVHRFLQYEGGTHRVQRVPDTETQGRVHTSAVTVAVLMEPDEESEIELNEADLRIDTYRSSGAGGQHVNTTDSAVRITHIPTGVVTYCQDDRSQHKNKDKAMRLLKAKLATLQEEKRMKEMADSRSSQVGSGDRSERIRTYNYPQNRITDHRINLTKYNLDRVMQGELEEFSSALVSHFYQQKFS